MNGLDETHDNALRSWVDSAQSEGTLFPVQNLPFGVFRTSPGEPWRIGVAIGDQIADLAVLADGGLLGPEFGDHSEFVADSLNDVMASGRARNRALRRAISRALRADTSEGTEARGNARAVVPMERAAMALPARVGDYTDFYASVYHATNVGSMFRPDNPLLPNYKWVPIGYHGRASSLVVSGTRVHRPVGQTNASGDGPPQFGPTQRLDYEAELGFFVGHGNQLGSTIPIAAAESHLFGVCLLNDWSARDIQAWEYQPLGPFLAKNFASTLSPWVVTWDALAPFRCPAFERGDGDPAPLPYLQQHGDAGVAIEIVVRLATAQMREQGLEPFVVSRSSSADLYWTPGQMIAHHASNGCNLQPGDLLGSGTISGATKESRGCLLERTWRGSEPLVLPTGEERRFLLDGDEVIMTAECCRDGFATIGFGECRGIVG